MAAAAGLKENVIVEVNVVPLVPGGMVPELASGVNIPEASPNDSIRHVRDDPPVLLMVSVRNAVRST